MGQLCFELLIIHSHMTISLVDSVNAVAPVSVRERERWRNALMIYAIRISLLVHCLHNCIINTCLLSLSLWLSVDVYECDLTSTMNLMSGRLSQVHQLLLLDALSSPLLLPASIHARHNALLRPSSTGASFSSQS